MELKSTRDAYGDILISLGKENKKVVVLDADVSKATKTCNFAKHFPERFFNVGVAEQNLMGVSAGLSLTGFIPIASTFAVFATGRAFDQIRNTIAYSKCNVKIVATHGGITVGEDGASHQAIEDIALMRTIPGMTVVVPADANQTKKAIRAAVNEKGPFYIRLGRSEEPIITSENSDYKLGSLDIIKEGSDIAILANGIMVFEALEATKMLATDGISSAVVNVHTVKPLDEKSILTLARKVKAIITAEEHSIIGGLGSAVAELISRNYIIPMGMVGIKDTFCESGKPEELKTKYGLKAANIREVSKETIGRVLK